ncbi:MAG: 30S ribosomal protein S2 [Candidatus Marinimicrobia bacterium]|jgi:small subunit ribosomal protein S2|nr:30S ribosomal protein S2 [Candidatus Neomarinimicrobiota bacterium]
MAEITIEKLISSGSHFGHLTSKWNPSMKNYVIMEKNGIHVIDLKQTMKAIDKASDLIGNIVRKGGEVLFVGTKKQAKDIIKEEAIRSNMHYIAERWLGGTLTNYVTIRKSVRHMKKLQKESQNENEWENFTKKEILQLIKEMNKLELVLGGIKNMKRLPDVLFIVDTNHENIAVSEAIKLDIPIIGIVDTDSDPSLIDVPIPANDDSYRTIQLITKQMTDAILAEKKGGKTDNYMKEEKIQDIKPKSVKKDQ